MKIKKFMLKVQEPKAEGFVSEYLNITEDMAFTELAIFLQRNTLPTGTRISITEWEYDAEKRGWKLKKLVTRKQVKEIEIPIYIRKKKKKKVDDLGLVDLKAEVPKSKAKRNLQDIVAEVLIRKSNRNLQDLRAK